MYIIGTAGHVDHGKTLLIKALTGIDTDRLPEEKKRGLTIDLGFAHFVTPSGEQIGVVDVPGHERFIRNMTAGAWGIDLALLVIAADDGWMYQTENHLRVLTASGIKKIITVITKADAEGGKPEETAEDAKLRILEKTGTEPPSIIVSALSGMNIPVLKQLIIDNLSAPHEAVSGFPVFHIDRSFGVKGAGLVVTGSLREGAVAKNDSLMLLPELKQVRIRGIQTYERETELAEPACRAAFNITGAGTTEIGRGCCLAAEGSGFSAETEFILRLTGDCTSVRNHSEAEFAAGTAHATGTIHLLKSSDSEEKQPSLARIVLKKTIPLRFGEAVIIIRKGGSLITGSGTVLWKGSTGRSERQLISAVAAGEAEISNTDLLLAVKGWAEDDGKWRVSDEKSAVIKKQIAGLASAQGGIRPEEIPGKLEIPSEVCSLIIEVMRVSEQLTERGGTLFINTPAEKPAELSAAAAKILKKAGESGTEGLDLGKTPIPGARKELRSLTRAGLIVPLNENLFYTAEVYNGLLSAVLNGLKTGETFDIAHAKNRTGLSRKYIIPFLNRMEEQGFVAREENLRRVRRTPV